MAHSAVNSKERTAVGVGLLGCGAIGTAVARAICSGEAGDVTLVGLFGRNEEKAYTLARQLQPRVKHFQDFERFIAMPQLGSVVECASSAAVAEYAELVLAAGMDLVIMSSGALADSERFQSLSRLANQMGAKLIVPSGALGGIDAIRAVRDQLEEVTLTTTKPPRAFRGSPGFQRWESEEIVDRQVIFEGFAQEAVGLFPTNVNVAATLSLAGIGPNRTRVRVVVDPGTAVNTHEIVAKGAFGVLHFRTELQPHPQNARTSALAVWSAIEALRSVYSAGPRVGT